MEILKVGSKGTDVKILQALLGCPIKQIDGIFGKGTEKLLKDWQQTNGLTPDGAVGPMTLKTLSNGVITENTDYVPIFVSLGDSPNRKIKYLVIHYTAGGNSKSGAAIKNRNVFITRDASADFVVDDETTVQVNPNPNNYYCWAVGDGKGKYGITNKDCISIEMCSTLKPGTSAAVPNHEGWSVSDKVLERTIELAKKLMVQYNIPKERVIRHYDASHKLCPGIIGWNPGVLYNATTGTKTSVFNTEEKWKEFLSKL